MYHVSVVHAGGGEKVVVRARGMVAVMMVVGDEKYRESRESKTSTFDGGQSRFQSA